MVSCGESRERTTWLMLPRDDCEIVDTWFASGLRGSGSKDVVVKDRFVPAHRAIDPNRAGDDDMGGWQLHRRPGYRVPLRVMTGWDLAAPIVGMAQGAVDEMVDRLRRSSGPGRTADSVPLQLRVAEASAEVDTARTLHHQSIRHIIDRAGGGEAFTELDRARYRRDKAFVVRLCVQAVNRLFDGAGARAILDSDPLQRMHRDVHGASHHAALQWDLAAEQYGREVLAGGRPS
jgi:3-hydroxy-9,10-secoandrosta-1,3,5(10)-triene-9,17-dione monooxygenase